MKLRIKRVSNKPKPQATAEVRQWAAARPRDQRNQSNAATEMLETGTAQRIHDLEVNKTRLENQIVDLQRDLVEFEKTLKKYSDLYDFSRVGYFSIDESGLILDVNLTGAVLLGIPRSRLIKRRLQPLIAEASRLNFLAFLKKVFTGHKQQTCDVLLLKKGGGTFLAGFQATSTIGLNGDQKCWIAFMDITTRKRADKLSARETEVLQLIALGKANKQAAADLGIAMRTVEKHRAHLMDKLDIHDTAGLTRYAISSGIIYKAPG